MGVRRLLVLFCLWQGSLTSAAAKEPTQPLFEGLGKHGRAVATANADAQRYFDQGLAFLYAFNHDEAMRSFQQAAALDPECAMAWWGIAISRGPHINNPVLPPEQAKLAVEALIKAGAHASKARPGDQALIAAASKRYVDPQPEDRKPLEEAYAAAMAEAWKKFPDDADIGALYAESLMDLHPWDLWSVDHKPREWTPQILEVLDAVLAISPNHPMAMHLYIHAVEASAEPGRADDVSDRLRTAMPGLGHMVHMPSHIDIRRGRWQQAVEANERAIVADSRYAQQAPMPGFYRLYMTHNHHMLIFAAMMQGQSKRAIEQTETMLAAVPSEWLDVEGNAAIIDGFMAARYEVPMRFGRWDELVNSKEPDERFPIARVMRHLGRAVAFGAEGKLSEARKAQRDFRAAVMATPPEAAFGNNKATDLFVVADAMLEGELLVHEGKSAAGLAFLRAAVAKEDTLRYDEPPDWIQPVRHTLGAALLRAGQAAEAEAVYHADLVRWPDNGWSLFGLAESLAAQQKGDEAEVVRACFKEVWRHADVQLTASCYCQAVRDKN